MMLQLGMLRFADVFLFIFGILRYPNDLGVIEKKKEIFKIDKARGREYTRKEKQERVRDRQKQLAHKNNNLVEEISQSHRRQTSGRIDSG